MIGAADNQLSRLHCLGQRVALDWAHAGATRGLPSECLDAERSAQRLPTATSRLESEPGDTLDCAAPRADPMGTWPMGRWAVHLRSLLPSPATCGYGHLARKHPLCLRNASQPCLGGSHGTTRYAAQSIRHLRLTCGPGFLLCGRKGGRTTSGYLSDRDLR